MSYRVQAMAGIGRDRRAWNWRDLAATVLVATMIVLLGLSARQMTAPFAAAQQPEILLSPLMLPIYALRTVTRMLAALLASLVFTFTYATLAAKSRRAEVILVPLLDFLQSVPILGFSLTLLFFLQLTPGRVAGAEMAAIFLIFTSQAWNMAFSFYHSLRSIPDELVEVARVRAPCKLNRPPARHGHLCPTTDRMRNALRCW